MSKCDISIELEKSSNRYSPGDVIRGVVKVSVNIACTCNGLNVELDWRTHGRGNLTGAKSSGCQLFRGPWEAGEQVSYPFEFKLPNGPLSYHGHYLNIDWRVRVWAEFVGGRDSYCERDILLIGSPKADPINYIGTSIGADGLDDKRWNNDGSVPRKKIYIFAACMVGGVFMVWLADVADSILNPVSMKIMGAVFFVGGLILVGVHARNMLASLVLGNIRIAWPEDPVQPADKLPISLHLNTNDELNAVNAELICREVVVSGSGTNTTRMSKELYSAPISLRRGFENKKRTTLDGTIELPPGAAPSFYAEHNELSWLIAVHIDIANWPDWKRDLYLDVRPGTSVSGLAGPPKI